MVLEFTKMNGAGNDFVLIDNRAGTVRLSPQQVAQLCHRQRGVGADGLVLWTTCASRKAAWAWDFYNNDGSVAEMCGNAARCFARYLQQRAPGNGQVTFETLAGVITAQIQGARVTVSLTAPQGLALNQTIDLRHGPQTVHSVNTGVPHAVVFVPDADQAMVQPLGAELRWHPFFAPKGTNVNFVQILAANRIRVRTYERGVEAETLACGTGVTAAALVTARVHQFQSPIQVQVQGGDQLEVSFTTQGDRFQEVRLTGPAEFVFEGKIQL